jgi:aspartyl aminopeptidase
MHSCYETAGTKDTEYLISAMTEFFSSSIRCVSENEYEII